MDTTTGDSHASLVTPDWTFNVMLDRIAEALTDNDLERMKSYCKGGYLGRKALTEAMTPLKFFQLLRDMEVLNCNNLLHLQAMLWHVGRRGLHKDIVTFARKCRRQPLYFFTPKGEPVNGYKHVKFHIGGSEANRRQVDYLRDFVAELLCVQNEDVILVGFEPSNSIVITFMVPEEAIESLFDLEREDKGVLKSMKVDYIFVDEDEISLIGENMQKPTTTAQIAAMSKLVKERDQYRSKLEKSQCLLQKRNEELLQSQKNEKNMQESRDQAFIAFLTLLNKQRPSTTTVDSLVSKSCMVYFRHSLRTLRSKFPDEMDTIEILLEAKELLACKAERDAWKQHAESMRLWNQLETNRLKIQHAMDITKLQGIRYNQKPPRLHINGNGIRQSGTIQLGVTMVTQQVQTGDILNEMAIVSAAETEYHNKVTKALVDISNMLNAAQQRSLLQLSGISESDANVYLKNSEHFIHHLYCTQSNGKAIDELEFALNTVRQLNDTKLDEKVCKVVMNVVKYRDRQHAMIQ
ncbi:uncharacterized protein LOC132550141 [Ylistrum balloti]|uniref:uncharacterized protein LOC132550141 n=1 Tax=Ylistrum balloti TaxID=509963 RepID=UPI002905DF64|nr:uncharacterized protein LOC132550141 [Ylistrum balloti]